MNDFENYIREAAEAAYRTGTFPESIPYLGKVVSVGILVQPGFRNAFVSGRDTLTMEVPEQCREQVWREALEVWYRKEAARVIGERAGIYAERIGVHYERISIKDQRTRWGSCSSKNNMNFSWRLVMMPPEVLDYVVIHELTHLVHMDHSKEFWADVEKVCPDYRAHVKWLKENGRYFMRYNRSEKR